MVDRLIQYKLGLFGHPVMHSQSPQIHAEFAKQFGLNIEYQLIDATEDTLSTKFKEWIKTAHGCNITVPHKNSVKPLVDKLTERAEHAGAVNTVYWRDEQLIGDNTDGDGLILDLKNKNVTLKDAQVLILGAGGAVQGIIPSLLSEAVSDIHILNRDTSKAANLATLFDRCKVATETNQFSYDLIIHATSMGHLKLCPELNQHWFKEGTVAYDLSYGIAAEPFLAAAKAGGVESAYDGIGMLFGQAALAFELWFGKTPRINIPKP